MDRRQSSIRPGNKNPINMILDNIKERENVLMQEIMRVNPDYEGSSPKKKLSRASSLINVPK